MTKTEAEAFLASASKALLSSASRATLEAALETALEELAQTHDLTRPEPTIFERLIKPLYGRPDEPELTDAERLEASLDRARGIAARKRAKTLLALGLKQHREVELTEDGGLLVREGTGL